MRANAGERGGFSLVELVIALVILTIGMLAMAAGSSYAMIQVRGSGVRSQRTAAVASVIEQLRARANSPATFTGLTSLPKSSGLLYGGVLVWYDVAYDATPTLVNAGGLRRITIWTQGSTYQSGHGWVTSAVEGTVFDLYRPLR